MFTDGDQDGEQLGRGSRGVVATIPLRTLRELANLSLRELTERMGPRSNGRPWAISTISQVENGSRGSSQELRDSLSRAFGLPPGSVHEETACRSKD